MKCNELSLTSVAMVILTCSLIIELPLSDKKSLYFAVNKLFNLTTTIIHVHRINLLNYVKGKTIVFSYILNGRRCQVVVSSIFRFQEDSPPLSPPPIFLFLLLLFK